MSQIFLSHIFLLKVELVCLNFCYCNYIKVAQFKETECSQESRHLIIKVKMYISYVYLRVHDTKLKTILGLPQANRPFALETRVPLWFQGTQSGK